MSAPQQSSARKRFWKQVDVVQEADGYAVQLDGRGVRLPGRMPLCVPSRALAEALAAEWRAAGQTADGSFTPAELPLTGIAGSMLERIPGAREGVRASLLAYAGSDLLCYRDAANPALAERQRTEWDPWLNWLARETGARLEVTLGVMPVAQSEQAVEALRVALATCSDAELAVLGVAAPALGSLVLGLALLREAASPAALAACATLDERAQMAVWGEDPEVTDRMAAMQDEVEHAARFLVLFRQG
ncbi:MAG: ATP12 family protein [Acetobacter papayae]